MLTKILVIVGISVGIVVAFFATGYLLDRKSQKDEAEKSSEK